MRDLVGLTLICGMIIFIAACTGNSKVAELVFQNGVIYPVDQAFSQAQVVAISGDKIVFVGSNEAVQKWIGKNTRVIDLAGKTVVPGFIDAHYHFLGVGRREFHLNLDGTKSLKEFLSKVKQEVQKTAPGKWISGRGWIEEDWPSKKFPSRYDLDRVAPDHPVFLRRADGHAAVVNSKALAMAGITAKTPDPQGGQIIKDPKTGKPTGILLDRAMALVTKVMPSDSDPEMKQNYARKANAVALQYGITQVHDMGVSWDTIDLYKELFQNGEMDIRLHAYIAGPGEGADRLLENGPEIGLFENHLTVRGIKIVQDGALGSRGACLLEPYSDFDTRGFLIHKDEEIYPTIEKAVENGIQMAIHAIGDSANRDVLNLYEKAFKAVPPAQRKIAEPRFRIEHAQIVALEDMPRFARLAVIPSMQPSHAIGDLHFAIRRLGLARMTEGYAWRTFIDLGCYIPAGSDAPVEEGNPMIEFYAASVRKDTLGYSAAGWHPELRMTREQALKSLTAWAAKAVFEEKIKGSLEPGKLADLVVLERNLMTEPEDRLFDIKVLMTVIGGKIVYQNENMLSPKN